MQSAVERLAGILTVVALLIAVATLVLLVRRRVPDWLRDEVALPVATAVALVTTVGSLWMSEVAEYTPCVLCWYQRIAVYPMVILAGVAAWRRDAQVWRYVVPLAVIGSAVSVWHIVIERVPSLSGPCDPAAPCAIRWVEEFGIFTLPVMALVAMICVALLTLAARPAAGADLDVDEVDAADTTLTR